MELTFLGVDGCRIGWFWVELRSGAGWDVGVERSARALGKRALESTLTLIDIPIGLRQSGADERVCDRAARKFLGAPRAASVFPVPARPALTAATYAEASSLNRGSTGRGLSRQSWTIAGRIRAIDELLRADRGSLGRIREVHPEICFWCLHGQRPMEHNKKSAAGREERRAILTRMLPAARRIIDAAGQRYRRREVAWDDIHDALACAVVAKCGFGRHATIPERPERDAFGLPMEMVYFTPGSGTGGRIGR